QLAHRAHRRSRAGRRRPRLPPEHDHVSEQAATSEAAPASGKAEREVLIEVKRLTKTFKLGFWGRRVEAVKGVSFEVRRGEIFGFLGPNGAGKTTTIKMLTGLIQPSGGQAFLFGVRVPAPAARQRLGFLPENPFVYPYLTPREFVEMSG